MPGTLSEIALGGELRMYNETININKEQWKKIFLDKSIFHEEDVELLKLVYASEKYMATAKQLASLLHVDHHGTINLQIGRLGKRIVEKLNITTSKRDDGSDRWWHVPFWGKDTKEGFYWILRPKLRKAMEELNYEGKIELLDKEFCIPEEINGEDEQNLFEGAKRQIYVNYYERNTIARKECINYYGAKCLICGFDFKKKYGEIGKDVIHVHHKKPLSEIGVDYKVDPVMDLIHVCPNCHLIIHKKKPPYKIEAVKEMMKNQRNIR
jgi:5-methylcytosine-specific restriction protein A